MQPPRDQNCPGLHGVLFGCVDDGFSSQEETQSDAMVVEPGTGAPVG